MRLYGFTVWLISVSPVNSIIAADSWFVTLTHTTVIYPQDVSSVLAFRANRREKKQQQQLYFCISLTSLRETRDMFLDLDTPTDIAAMVWTCPTGVVTSPRLASKWRYRSSWRDGIRNRVPFRNCSWCEGFLKFCCLFHPAESLVPVISNRAALSYRKSSYLLTYLFRFHIRINFRMACTISDLTW